MSEDDLDCERGMGNYWEDSGRNDRFQHVATDFPSSDYVAPLTLHTVAPRQVHAARVVYPVTGSSGYRDEPPIDEPGGDRHATGGGSGRQIEYYAEERYWTDYLRIILPILGVLLFLVLLYLWALAFLRGDDDPPGQAGAGATATLPLIVAGTATSGINATPANGTPSIILTPAPIVTQPPGTITTPIPTETPPDGPSGEIFIGAFVSIANTGGTGANLRSDATTDSEVIDVLLDGAELEVIDGPVEALGFIWWNVSGDAGTGWVVADYLALLE